METYKGYPVELIPALTPINEAEEYIFSVLVHGFNLRSIKITEKELNILNSDCNSVIEKKVLLEKNAERPMTMGNEPNSIEGSGTEIGYDEINELEKMCSLSFTAAFDDLTKDWKSKKNTFDNITIYGLTVLKKSEKFLKSVFAEWYHSSGQSLLKSKSSFKRVFSKDGSGCLSVVLFTAAIFYILCFAH
jgi:hypothetical protein